MENTKRSKYYECAIIGTSFSFTYEGDDEFELFDIVSLPLKNSTKQAVIIDIKDSVSFECKKIKSLIYRPTQKEIEFIKFIKEYYFATYGEVVALFNFIPNTLTHTPTLQTDITLTPKQTQALQFCQNNQISILFGDTGSGKTEIYIKFIQDILNQGKNAIFLLPEIAITSQIEKRLKKHFHDLVAIWHSKITKTKKQQILQQIQEGKIKILAGARSALFVGMPNIGVIIVDECHDDSYKSQTIPMYNAKDLAIYQAKLHNAHAILGSATPLVSDIYKHKYFRLRGNFANTQNKVSFITNFADSFADIKHTLKNKGQVIIFIPTRANFKYMICAKCAKAIKCPFCDVGMSIHSKERILKCHYCSYATQIPQTCPNCGSDEFLNERIGSSEIVEILKEHFDASIQKFDRDIITSKSRIDKILKDFHNKKIDILVGTQMLSKGHDYDVDLAIILDIDFILNMSDFRAREKALSLAVQVAGRAGRRKNAKVLIQTLNQDFFKLSYDEFIKEELEFRKELKYPPFCNLIKLEFSNKDQNKAYNEMMKVKTCLEKKMEILGFGESPISKIANKYRYQILLKANRFLQNIWACKTEHTKVDVNPVNFV
ncbi:MAG: primosomal protein N' [Epsilonproteobacteria bacterium]|nr:primosomal protein N' [Campylobacterota bacterium]